MKAAELFVKALEQEGVEYVFGLPGEENLDLLEALRNSRIKFVVARHEQAAGFMAAAYGRFTERPGVALSTLGPGATNFLTAAAYAQLGGYPLVLITAQKPLKKSQQGLFQLVDIVSIFKPITKFAKQVDRSRDIPVLVRNAFRAAQTERPGCTLLELPEDVARQNVSIKLAKKSSGKINKAPESAISQVVKLIERARRPLVLVAGSAHRGQAPRWLRQFIKKTRIPFVSTQLGKGAVSEDSPGYLGTAVFSSGEYAHCAIDRADAVISVGYDVTAKPPFFSKSGKLSVVHINFFPSSHREIYLPAYQVIGDIGWSLRRIIKKLRPQAHWDFSYFSKIKQLGESDFKQNTNARSFPIHPRTLTREVRKVFPEDGILSLDNGMFKLWFSRYYRAYHPKTFLVDNNLATMGAGLPAAITASLLYPRRKVLAVVGDGGFLMNSGELETAVRLGLHVVVLVVNDGGYGMIKWKQREMGFKDFGLNFGNPDFVKYAESYGARGWRVKSAKDLVSVLQKTLNSRGVHVVDVPVDYSENNRVFNRNASNQPCP